MELKLISAEERRLLRPLKRLYLSAFPRCERKPFGLLLKNRREGKAEILAALDGEGEFCGLAILHFSGDLVLLAYFAVSPSARGRGIGSGLLRLLLSRYADRRFFLEIERVDLGRDPSGIKARRKNFYLRNGMDETGLIVRLFGVELEILSYRCAVTFEEYRALYRSVTGRIVDKNVLPLERTTP
ncbi:MAG: GNAT family N-acetyltransferase [Bacteroides sp.]|nr:GNAT family N-acetyltransferase [Eubacterium sp.]MCM1417212.1 GNAT family N-acetyltransferase [Roseburia sp.]MCM1461167.1 GNAT family N-acetyltransferase [Bacteroides sp.]